jgi:hypothetical protein
MRARSLALLAVVFLGCPKQLETRVAGTDDSRIDSAAARLEELRVRGRQEGLSCEGRCAVATESCTVAEELCGWVERNPDRTDLPPRCIQAREQCAQGRSDCSRCRNL